MSFDCCLGSLKATEDRPLHFQDDTGKVYLIFFSLKDLLKRSVLLDFGFMALYLYHEDIQSLQALYLYHEDIKSLQ